MSHAHTLAEARKLNAKCIWKIYKDDGTPAKTPSSKSWARLQYQSLQHDCDSLFATKNHVTMHQGVEIPAFAPGDPLNDLKAGILSFHIAPSARERLEEMGTIQDVAGGQPRHPRTAHTQVVARREEKGTHPKPQKVKPKPRTENRAPQTKREHTPNSFAL